MEGLFSNESNVWLEGSVRTIEYTGLNAVLVAAGATDWAELKEEVGEELVWA